MEEKIDYNNFDREEGLNDILQEDQGQFWRFSILIFCFIIISLITLSWFISYPDILSANITITNNNTPGVLVTKSEGLIEYLNKNKKVENEEIIAIIKSSVNYKEVFELKDQIMALKDIEISKYRLKMLDDYSNLGSIQTGFNDFTNLLLEYERAKRGETYYSTQTYLKKELRLLREKLSLLRNKLLLLDSKIEIETERFNRDTSLYSQKVISKIDVENTKSSFINEKVKKSEGELLVIEYQTRINNLEKTLSQKELGQKDILFEMRSKILASFTELEFLIKAWEEVHVIKSPKAGDLSFVREINENDFLSRNEEFAFVVPAENKSNYGLALVPARNYGKLELGQKVIIKLENLDYREFGVLIGNVTETSRIPTKGFYSVRVEFEDKNLVTNQGFQLEHQVVYLGTAEIITEELRLLERFLYQLKPVFDSENSTNNRIKKDTTEVDVDDTASVESAIEIKTSNDNSPDADTSCIVAVGKFAENGNIERMSGILLNMGLKIYMSGLDEENRLTLVGFYSDCSDEILSSNIKMARNEIAIDAYSLKVLD